MIATDGQVAAAQRHWPKIEGSRVRLAVDAAIEALGQGLPSLLAINAAASKIDPQFAKLGDESRQLFLVDVVNGLLAADKVAELVDGGFLRVTLRVVRKAR